MRMLLRIAVISVFGGFVAVAQSDSASPSLGVLYDPGAKAIRPVWGIPGSAFYGAPLDIGLRLSSAAIAPAQNVALVSGPDGVFVVRLKSGSASALPIDGAGRNPDLVVMSPSGSFGALYYGDRKVITIVGPFSSDPPAVRDVSSAALGSTPRSLAISDDAGLVLTLVPDGGDPPATNVMLLDTGSGAARTILTTSHGSAIAFVPGKNDAVQADDIERSVSLITDVAGRAQRTVLISSDSRLSSPSELQIASDGQHVLAASRTDGGLAMLDPGGGDPVFLNCHCEPSGLRRLGGDALYQITPLNDGVAWIVEWTSANPRLLFLPPEIASVVNSLNITGDN